jgi:hypothetical protein
MTVFTTQHRHDAAVNALAEAFRTHSERLSTYWTAVQIGNRELMHLNLRKLKESIGQCRAAHNDARQARVGGHRLLRSVADLLDELEACRVSLVAALDRADEPEARAMLREVAALIDERLGVDERKALMMAASEAVRAREAATVSRRMEAGNAITLGSSGGTRRRVG